LAIAVFNALQVFLLVVVVRDHPPGQQPASGQDQKPSIFKGLGFFLTYSYWAISLATFVRYGYFVALQALWAAPFMVYGLGSSPLAMANAILAMNLGIMIGMPVMGKLSDQVLQTRKHLIWPKLILYGLMVWALVLLERDTPVWIIYALFFAVGVSSSSGQIMYAHVKELVPPGQTGQAMTAINLFTMLGGAVFTQILGAVLPGDPAAITSPEGYAVIFWLGAGSLALAGVLYVFVPESRAMGRRKKGGAPSSLKPEGDYHVGL
jgi:sugar phosphate permease